MRLLIGIFLTLLIASVSQSVTAQTPAERTDLVLMLIWQNDDGSLLDKRYIRHVEVSEQACLDARGSARLIWSARKNANMVGQSICIAPGDPVPTLGIGTFQVIVEGEGAAGS